MKTATRRSTSSLPMIRRALFTLLCVLLLPISASGQEVDPSLLKGMRPRSIGPAGMSGRIAAIDAVESDPNIVYVGAATGGLWKSVNGGQTWTPLFDEERVSGIGSVAIFQANPDVVWVGTGEGNPRNSAGVGAGIYKSVDGGHTWMFLGLGESERIHRIVLHPTDPDVAYVGALGPAWSDGEERGVFRTTDGGESWQKVLYVDQKTGVSDMVMDPQNPDKLFVGMWEYRRWPWFFESGGPSSGLYVTYDGGDSWRQFTSEDGIPDGDLGRIGLATARSNPEVVYALIEARPSELLRSTDGGRSWETVNNERGVASRPFYYADIFVDPENELRLFNLNSRVMLSEDGGKSFETIAQDVHSDFHALWINPGDSRHMFIGTDGGVYVSRDRGRNWRFIDNLPVGQFYHISVDMEIPYNIYGGMQDNGSWRGPSDVWENGGIRNYHWIEVGFGDGFATLIDPTDSDLGYYMSQQGNLGRFDLRTGERKNVPPWGPETIPLRFNWNAAIATDPFEVGTIYYGSQFVHKSPDRGHSWQIISPDLTTNDPDKQRARESGGITRDGTGAENHTTIMTIAPSPVERQLIWVGTDDGRVHLTRAGGGHWEDVGSRIRGVPDGTWVPHIEPSKFFGGTAWVIFDDHRRGNWKPYIYRTENYGEDWDNIADDDQIWGFVHVLEQDPVVPGLLYAGTEFGLYVSLNHGDDWFKWTHGFPTAPVRALTVHPRDHDLVIGTHGRALYVLDDVRPLRELALDPGITMQPVHLFEPPPAYLRSVAQVDGYHFSAQAVFQGETRPLGALLTYYVGQGDPDGEATIQILDDMGDVVRTLTGPLEAGVNRTSWNMRSDPPAGGNQQQGQRGGGSRSGPEVLPGRYAVRIQVGDAQVTRDLEVLPDPRVEVSLEERLAKYDAIRHGQELNAALTRVQSALAQVTESVDRVSGLIEARNDQSTQALRESASSLRQDISDAREGIQEANQHRRMVRGLGSSRDAPTEAQRIALMRMEDAVNLLIVRVNGLVEGEVADFRRQVAAAGIDPFPEVSTIRRQ